MKKTPKRTKATSQAAMRREVAHDMNTNGIHISEECQLIFDGKPHYIDVRDKHRGAKKVWFIGFPQSGVACYAKFSWCGRRKVFRMKRAVEQLDPKSRLEIEWEIRKQLAKHSVEIRQKQKLAATSATALWEESAPAKSHRYLKAKKIAPLGLRIHAEDGRLMVPVRAPSGEITSIQFIDDCGKKRYMPGGRVHGCSYLVGEIVENATAIICEGAATAHSLHEATRMPVVAALSAGNLSHAAIELRTAYPLLKIVVAADLDKGAGLRAARKAARLVDGWLSAPTRKRKGEHVDFNDVARQNGPDAVHQAVAGARPFGDWPPALPERPQSPDSHAANAYRFATHFGRDFSFVPSVGWFRWNGRWERATAMRMAFQQLAQIVKNEAEEAQKQAIMGPEEQRFGQKELAKKLNAWVKGCEQRANVSAAMSFAEDLLAKKQTSFDTDPWLFGCSNGILDLHKRAFRPYRRTDFMLKSGGCAFSPTAKCPKWLEFIDQVCLGDQSYAEYLQRFAGYLLYGKRPDQLFFMLTGPGRNGKGVFLNIMQTVLGTYATTGQPDLLVKPPAPKHLTELAELEGYRFVVCTENERHAPLYISRVKALTGGDNVKARLVHKDAIEFRSDMQFVLQTNHPPAVRDRDPAIWRRIVVLPFDAHVSDEQEDAGLVDQLLEEAPGILNWMLDGFRNYQLAGLKQAQPVKVKAATKAYWARENAVEQFVEEQCERVQHRTPSSTMEKAFNKWARKLGLPSMNSTALGKALGALGVERWHTKSMRGWLLRLRG